MALGININHVFALAWILSLVVGTLSGILLGNLVGLQASVAFLN
jgi:branched-subunit amino acid ABC-type transport system permease component